MSGIPIKHSEFIGASQGINEILGHIEVPQPPIFNVPEERKGDLFYSCHEEKPAFINNYQEDVHMPNLNEEADFMARLS